MWCNCPKTLITVILLCILLSVAFGYGKGYPKCQIAIVLFCVGFMVSIYK